MSTTPTTPPTLPAQRAPYASYAAGARTNAAANLPGTTGLRILPDPAAQPAITVDIAARALAAAKASGNYVPLPSRR